MESFTVTTKLFIEGTFTVKADDKEQAEEFVRKHCGLVVGGNIHSSLPDDQIDWNFPTHFEKEIIAVDGKEKMYFSVVDKTGRGNKGEMHEEKLLGYMDGEEDWISGKTINEWLEEEPTIGDTFETRTTKITRIN